MRHQVALQLFHIFTPPVHTLFLLVPSIILDCFWSNLLISHTHTHVFYHNWVALWGYPLPCVDENKLALEKTGGLRGFEAFCLLEKWILLWTADHFYPRALSRTSFEKQLYFSDSLANLCLQDCLVFIMVIQVFTKTEGFFFSLFHYSNSWKSIWKVHLYVCPDVEPLLVRPAGIKVSFV